MAGEERPWVTDPTELEERLRELLASSEILYNHQIDKSLLEVNPEIDNQEAILTTEQDGGIHLLLAEMEAKVRFTFLLKSLLDKKRKGAFVELELSKQEARFSSESKPNAKFFDNAEIERRIRELGFSMPISAWTLIGLNEGVSALSPQAPTPKLKGKEKKIALKALKAALADPRQEFNQFESGDGRNTPLVRLLRKTFADALQKSHGIANFSFDLLIQKRGPKLVRASLLVTVPSDTMP